MATYLTSQEPGGKGRGRGPVLHKWVNLVFGICPRVKRCQLRIWILEPIPILQIQLTCGMSMMMVCFFSWISQHMHFLSILDTSSLVIN